MFAAITSSTTATRTTFATAAAAEAAISAINADADVASDYVVESTSNGFVIAVYVDGEFVFCL